MKVTNFKVAYMDGGDPYTLYSEFFDTESEAIQREQNLKNQGYEAMRMTLASNEGGNYQWNIDKSSASLKYRIGTLMTSTKVIIPLVILIFAYMLVRKNNGLPNIIA